MCDSCLWRQFWWYFRLICVMVTMQIYWRGIWRYYKQWCIFWCQIWFHRSTFHSRKFIEKIFSRWFISWKSIHFVSVAQNYFLQRWNRIDFPFYNDIPCRNFVHSFGERVFYISQDFLVSEGEVIWFKTLLGSSDFSQIIPFIIVWHTIILKNF